MLLAVDPDSNAFHLGQWLGGPVLIFVGMLLIGLAQRAARRPERSGGAKRVIGVVLIAAGGLSLVGTVASEVRERREEAAAGKDGFASELPATIVNTAIRQMQDSVTTLTIDGNGPTATGGRYAVKTSFDEDGRCMTRLREGKAQQTFIIDGNDAYVRANLAGWSALLRTEKIARQVLDQAGTRWTRLPLDDVVGDGNTGLSPDRFCDPEKLFDSMDGSDGGRGMTVGSQGAIGGQQAVEVVEKTSKATTKIWVAIEEPHYILRLEIVSGTHVADSTFSDFNDPQRSFELAADRVVDLPLLTGG